MPVFEYKALTEKGSPTKGLIDADTPREAREKLRSKRIHVTEMIKVERGGALVPAGGGGGNATATATSPARAGAPAGAGKLSGRIGKAIRWDAIKLKRGGANLADLAMVTRQLSTLLRAGIPLSDALNALIQQLEDKGMERAFRQIKEDIASGSGTADAFARHPRYFNDLYVNMIRAGEASGNLDEILHRLAEYIHRQAKMRGKVSAALMYPLIMIVLGIAVVTYLMMFVVPKIVASIIERGLPLPLPTEILMGISRFLADWWWALLIAIFALYAAYKVATSSPQGRLTRDTWKLKIPIFGVLFKKQSVARFATTFSTLLKSGIPALECLKILRDVVDNALLAKTLDEVHDRIVEGADIATPLKNSKVFPPVVGYMIAIGEQSGQLEDILEKIAVAYDEEIDVTTQKVTSMIEPVIIVIMATVVGFIVLSVVLPLIQGFDILEGK